MASLNPPMRDAAKARSADSSARLASLAATCFWRSSRSFFLPKLCQAVIEEAKVLRVDIGRQRLHRCRNLPKPDVNV
jgi:hypothetical protein